MIRVNLHEQLGGRTARMPRWAAWLAMAASLVVGVVLFLVAASLALILIPIVAIVGTIAVWRLRRRMKAAGFGQPGPFPQQGHQAGAAEIIDAEYRIIESGEPPRR
jgi:membrane protein implicated in regulation of membrane protease activity